MASEQKTSPFGTDISLLGEEHVRRYRETDGEVGYLWNGATVLLLTTRGRKTGQPRTTPLIFCQVGERYVVIASKGGAPQHPAWYLNLCADPRVEVQIRNERFAALARTAESPEREELWAAAVAQWPNYEAYQARTQRRIPVVVLERVR
ncbi:MAG: nitroreductase [Porticoccaceae bacterium]|nr:MAG: nitroreductase [Porticoccaceae bacterium]